MARYPTSKTALMNLRTFRSGHQVAFLYNILGSSAHNIHAYDRHVGSYEEQVAELHVDPAFGDENTVPLTGTWLHATFVPDTEHDWRGCCVLRLDPTPDDDRPVGPEAPREEIPRGKSLLSLDKLHGLFSGFQDRVLHHCSTRDRVLLLVPVKGSEERAPAVLRDAQLSERGFGTRLFLDAVIVRDHNLLMRDYGPPYPA